jgi:two-component system, LytTR family, response regulator
MKPTAPREVLLVDDEAHGRRHLRELLTARSDFVVAGEADSVASAAAWCAARRPALILLDVQMPLQDGFALLPLLPAPAPKVIFVTAHDAFAVRAFEVNALDYLLKPVTPERLARALERLETASPTPAREPSLVTAWRWDDRVLLRDGDRRRLVPVRLIAAVEADGNFSRVHLTDDVAYHVLRSIGEWASNLAGLDGFVRVDRSLLVNLREVIGLQAEPGGAARLGLRGVEPTTLILGRTAATRMRAALRGAAGHDRVAGTP